MNKVINNEKSKYLFVSDGPLYWITFYLKYIFDSICYFDCVLMEELYNSIIMH